jgi:hypothetical protein
MDHYAEHHMERVTPSIGMVAPAVVEGPRLCGLLKLPQEAIQMGAFIRVESDGHEPSISLSGLVG